MEGQRGVATVLGMVMMKDDKKSKMATVGDGDDEDDKKSKK